ncbi:MAG: YopX family protein [Candidatus Amulumruptor caecigallinarius]|nr:YopX family protein [Candidatus Amulumruptor caecigallinarius]MCM1397446.1 YopX family protein [Candidatus Amulumruptor caecigallinarius]MCM1454347.1 YopX family protein [bacterium]
MRPIKFRGKRLDNSEWCYGYYTFANNSHTIQWENEDNAPWWADVEPYTIGQFTGCSDKNGKEIYEDDVVLLKDNKVAVVKYQPNLYGFYADFHTLDQWDMEVIGNIHDNPQYNR